MKKLLSVAFIIVFALFLFMARISKYHEYHVAEIKGKVDTAYRYKDYVMLYVDNVEYRIIPICLNGKYPLEIYAKKGDSVFKPKNRDTLQLIHDGDESISYTVKKF